jgi:hypothetical protein
MGMFGQFLGGLQAMGNPQAAPQFAGQTPMQPGGVAPQGAPQQAAPGQQMPNPQTSWSALLNSGQGNPLQRQMMQQQPGQQMQQPGLLANQNYGAPQMPQQQGGQGNLAALLQMLHGRFQGSAT